MTMLPDIDEASWDEYQQQELQRQMQAKQEQFTLQQVLQDKIAQVGAIAPPMPSSTRPPSDLGWAEPAPPPAPPQPTPAPPQPTPAAPEPAPVPEPVAQPSEPSHWDQFTSAVSNLIPKPQPSPEPQPAPEPVPVPAAPAPETAPVSAPSAEPSHWDQFTSSVAQAAAPVQSHWDQFTSSLTGQPQAAQPSDGVPTTPPMVAGIGQGKDAFISTLAPLAQFHSQQTGIDPSVYLAIAANETGWGKSQTAQKQNNLFSIQGSNAGGRWAGYASPEESFSAFDNLISTAPRYKDAWANRQDPAAFVNGLRQAGYVVDEPGYPAQGWVNQVGSIQRDLASSGALQSAQSDGAVAPPHRPAAPQQGTPGGAVILNTGNANDTGQVFPLAIKSSNRPDATYHGAGGSDLMAPRGTPVAAMMGGKVIETFIDKGDHQVGGNAVLIRGNDGLDYYYAHFDQPSPVKIGDTVQTGQQIGAVGNSGNAWKGGQGETHLHLGIGHGISNGVGAEGGLGQNYNAQAVLNQLYGNVGTMPLDNPVKTAATAVANAGQAAAQTVSNAAQSAQQSVADLFRAPPQQQDVSISSRQPVYNSTLEPAVPEESQSPVDRLKSAFSDFVDSIGSTQAARNIMGTNPDQYELDQRQREAEEAARQVTGLSPRIPSNPLEMLGGAPLGGAAFDIGTGELRTEERNRAIEEANPLRDIPGTSGVAQAVLDPTNAVLFGGPTAERLLAGAGRETLLAATSPEAQALLRSRMPAEAEAGFAAGLPTFGSKPVHEMTPSEQAKAFSEFNKLPFGEGGAQPKTGQDLLNSALSRLQTNYPDDVANEVSSWVGRIDAPASEIASTIERWMVDNPIGSVSPAPTAREVAEIVNEIKTDLAPPGGKNVNLRPSRPEREQMPLFEGETETPVPTAYEPRMPEGEGGPGVPSARATPDEQNWLRRLEQAKTQADFDSIARDLDRAGLTGERPSAISEGGQSVMPGFEEGRQPNLPEGTGGPGLPEARTSPETLNWLERLKQARTQEDFATIKADLERNGLIGGRTSVQPDEGYLPGFEPLNPDVAKEDFSNLYVALQRLGLLSGEKAAEEAPLAPGLNYGRLAGIRNEGETARVPGMENVAEKEAPWFKNANRIQAFLSSNMLLGPHSLFMNATSQSENTARAPIIRALAGYPDEAIQGVRMLAAATGDGLGGMLNVLRTGRQAHVLEDTPHGVIHWESPGLRANAALDEAYRTVAGAQEMGMDAARYIRENPDMTKEEVLDKFAPQLREAAARGASHSVFQDGPGGLGGKISELRTKLIDQPDRPLTVKEIDGVKQVVQEDPNRLKQGLGWLLYAAVPFSRVPEAVWTSGLKRLPAVNEALGTGKFIQAYRNGDAREMRMTAAETGLDSAINLAILGEAMAGNITGANDPEHPWSIKLPGEHYMDYRGLGPVAVRIGAIANVVEANGKQMNQLKPNALTDMLDQTGAMASQQWYLNSTLGTLALIREGHLSQAASKFVAQSGDRLVPEGSLLNWIEQSTDPLMRDPSKEMPNALWERQQSRIPGLAEMLPAQVSTTTGEGTERAEHGFLATALGVETDLADPVKKELSDLHRQGFVLQPPPSNTKEVEAFGAQIPFENDNERRAYLEGRGKYIANAGKGIETEGYKKASPEGRAGYWEKILAESAKFGNDALRKYVGDAEFDRRVRAGQTRTGKLTPLPPKENP